VIHGKARPEKIRIGVIGAGWWATSAYIPANHLHSHAELVPVQSRERANAERIANDFSAKHAGTGWGELLALAILALILSLAF